MFIKYLLPLILTISTECADQPNIIFILADDVGWNDFSFHGSDQIQTPNIDALAYNGVILHQHYVQPICTPTRSALMTGRYPSNIGMQGSPIGAAEPRALPQGKILPQYLKDLGYVTHMVGKWHLGYYKEEFVPINRGFDTFLGYYNGALSYYDHILQQGTLQGLDFRRNISVASDLSGKYATDIFTEEAERIIQEHDTSTPLFLYLAHLACHAGNKGKLLEAPQEVIDKFPYIIEPNRKTYAAMITKLDESLGRVVKALEEANMLNNSIIAFMSDNGAPTVGEVFQNWGSNYPLRGIKSTQWEGGVRNPAMIWSPLFEHRVSLDLMHITDWLPTLYSAAGGSAMDVELDGLDQWQTLLQTGQSPRSNVLLEMDEVKQIYSFRDNDWKIVQGSLSDESMDGHYGDNGKTSDNPEYNVTAVLNSNVSSALAQLSDTKWVGQDEVLQIRKQVTVMCPEQENVTPCNPLDKTPCLFNLTADPCETNNLAEAYPEIVEQMTQQFTGFWRTLVNQTNQPTDVAADPRNFNNVWSPWVSE